MTDAASEVPQPPRRSRLPLLAGLVLCAAGAGGGYFAMQSGLSLPGLGQDDQGPAIAGDSVFLEVAPMVVSLGGDGTGRHLRFAATLEVPRRHQSEVATLMPRILDVFNGYLRAVEPVRLEEPGALVRLRAQLLRRLQVVTGDGRVRDLLVTEFVLN